MNICAGRYVRGVYLYSQWKHADEMTKKVLMDEILNMFDLAEDEMFILQNIVKQEIEASPFEPTQDE